MSLIALMFGALVVIILGTLAFFLSWNFLFFRFIYCVWCCALISLWTYADCRLDISNCRWIHFRVMLIDYLFFILTGIFDIFWNPALEELIHIIIRLMFRVLIINIWHKLRRKSFLSELFSFLSCQQNC